MKSKKTAINCVLLLAFVFAQSYSVKAFAVEPVKETKDAKAVKEAKEEKEKKEAKSILKVKEVIQKIKDIGAEGAFTAINESNLLTTDLSHGLMVYDLSGVVKAWNVVPSYTGKNIREIPDMRGVKTIKENIEKAKDEPNGWYSSRMVNPVTGRPQGLRVYYESYGEFIIACAFFE